MTPTESLALIHRILCLTWAEGYESAIMFRPDEDNVTVTAHVILNDIFGWACADAEDITPENVGEFEKALAEVKAVSEDGCHTLGDAAILFACRMRKLKPFKHHGRYPVDDLVVPLIEALPYPEASK